jgi:hypothetical protein
LTQHHNLFQFAQFLPVTHRYSAYGTSLESDSFVPGLRQEYASSRHPDIFLELSGKPSWVRDAERLPSAILHEKGASHETLDPAFTLSVLGEGQFFQLAYSDGTRFVLDAETTRIWGTCGPSQTLEDLAAYLVGPVMGFVLRQRGKTALHASAMCIGAKAVVLTGAAEAGKSTTAAALALRGVPVLCEDIVPLEETPDGFIVEPGHPRICLWPDSVNYLMGSPDALPRLSPNWEKCYLPLDGVRATLETQRHLLGAVYVLSPRVANSEAPKIEPLSTTETLLSLVQNTYMNWLLDREQRAAEFGVLSQLLSHVPGRRIIPHQDPARIGALCDLIVADAERLLANRMTAVHAASR